MERYKFDKLTNIEKVNYINEEFRRGLSIKVLCVNLKIGKTKLSNIIKNEGFIFDKNLRQYCKAGEVAEEVCATEYISQAKEVVEKIAHNVDHEKGFNIPTKIKEKANTQAFNVVVDKNLVKN